MISIRKIGIIGRTYRHLNRYRQILAALFIPVADHRFGGRVETAQVGPPLFGVLYIPERG